MMGIETIKAMNRGAAAKAAQDDMRPYVYWDEAELDETRGFPFPNFGDYRPKGWEMVDRHFVDSSGFGADDEPALSVRQFTELVRERIKSGWAIIEAGQFQVWVGEFQRKEG